jgi:hypothetical protein
MAFWYSVWSFGIFLRFGMFGRRKIWQPWNSQYLVSCPAPIELALRSEMFVRAVFKLVSRKKKKKHVSRVELSKKDFFHELKVGQVQDRIKRRLRL